MKEFAIIGHFGDGRVCLNGQTIKTQNVYDAIGNEIGAENILRIDSSSGIRFLLQLPIILADTLHKAQRIVILPAQNGVRIIPILLVLLNHLFNRELYYIVIGGWLPAMCKKRRILCYFLKRLNHIFVETGMMQKELAQIGISNVSVMPNFKCIPIRDEKEIATQEFNAPYPLCTFSRVSQTKGIEEAIEAVKQANNRCGKIMSSLDIYGEIEDNAWFSQLLEKQPDFIQYKGMVSPNESSKTLSKYYLLLFPTYYPGEGFAGTIIDALAAGTPIIATDWHNNSEIVHDGENGYLVPIKDAKSISDILCRLATSDTDLKVLRQNCLDIAKQYTPHRVIGEFLTTINYTTTQCKITD